MKPFAVFFALTFLLLSCQQSSQDKKTPSASKVEQNTVVEKDEPLTKDENYYISKGYQVFSNYKFAVNLPFKLTDLSKESRDSHEFNFGGFVNRNSQTKVVFYQIIINSLKSTYNSLSPTEKKEFEEKLIKEKIPANHSIINIYGQNTYSFDYKQNNYDAKALFFIRDGKTFGFTIITNENISEKFENFINNVFFLEN